VLRSRPLPAQGSSGVIGGYISKQGRSSSRQRREVLRACVVDVDPAARTPRAPLARARGSIPDGGQSTAVPAYLGGLFQKAIKKD
jgi:hypothetical protein